MANVLIVAYLLIVVALIAVILLQRSEGGALGIGGGGGGGLVSARGSANLLSRTTAILAALFMATAIGLTVISDLDRSTDSILDNAAAGGGEASSVLDALNALQPDSDFNLPATTNEAPAADTPDGNASSEGAPTSDGPTSDGPDLALPSSDSEPAAQ